MDAKKAAEDASRAEADIAERTAREAEWKGGQSVRDGRSMIVRNRKSFVNIIAEDRESKANNISIDTYL